MPAFLSRERRNVVYGHAGHRRVATIQAWCALSDA